MQRAVTYASVPFVEEVDWTPFDYISLDHYRSSRNRAIYGAQLHYYSNYHKPIVITEVGCCTYKGAEDAGGMGWAILVPAESSESLFNRDYMRDEGLQARELTDLLTILGRSGVEGAFLFTFVSPTLTHAENPRQDLDMASYSLVKTYAGKDGETYPDMSWDPKEAFWAVSKYFDEE